MGSVVVGLCGRPCVSLMKPGSFKPFYLMLLLLWAEEWPESWPKSLVPSTTHWEGIPGGRLHKLPQ